MAEDPKMDVAALVSKTLDEADPDLRRQARQVPHEWRPMEPAWG